MLDIVETAGLLRDMQNRIFTDSMEVKVLYSRYFDDELKEMMTNDIRILQYRVDTAQMTVHQCTQQ
jgi:hypothetical protein